jgi:hypothetical protein
MVDFIVVLSFGKHQPKRKYPRKLKRKIKIKKSTRGTFTRRAKKEGKTILQLANELIKKYKGKKGLTAHQKVWLRRAVFAKNAQKWRK